MKEKMLKWNLVKGNALSVKMHGSIQVGSVMVKKMDGAGVGCGRLRQLEVWGFQTGMQGLPGQVAAFFIGYDKI